jgi:hypothetical protein
MPQSIWTISSFGGGNSGSELIGCHIKETDTGYDFTQPNNNQLASVMGKGLPFTFPEFRFGKWNWTITVDSLSNPATGDWKNNAPNIKEEEGTWSAGAGADEEVDEGEQSAAAGN